MAALSDGGWSIDMTNVTNASKMFADCTSLMIVNISNVEKYKMLLICSLIVKT